MYSLPLSGNTTGTIVKRFIITVALAASTLQPLSAQSWIQLAPSGTLLNGRVGASAVFSPASNRLVVFGGYPVHTASPYPFLNDLWILSGANGAGSSSWQQAIAQGAAGSPSPRNAHSAVYDPTSNRMIVFGGSSSSGAYNDTWVLTNADGTGGTPSWMQLFPANPPPGRDSHAAAYDPTTNRMIVMGGTSFASGSQIVFGDLWVLTNANGTGPTPPAWIQLSPGGAVPPGRMGFASGYDSNANQLVVYGGRGSPTTILHDTWVLSNANGLGGIPTWTQLFPSGSGPRPSDIFPVSVYDPTAQRLTIFGGCFSDSTNATFVLTNATGFGGPPSWQALNPSGALPLPRCQAQGDYDQANNRLIVFGGQDIIGPGNAITLNDSWILTNANGIVGSEVSVMQAIPNHGGNAGTVTAQIIGSGFQSGATVKLTGLGPIIVGANTTVPNTSVLTATFDLTGAVTGVRDLFVTNPDGTTAIFTGGFTVEKGGAAQNWVNIVGRDKIRIGAQQIFYVMYGNRGNVDAAVVPLWVQVPSNVQISAVLPFSLTSTTSSSPALASTPTPLRLQATATAKTLDPSQYEVSIGNTTVIPIMLPFVPTGSSNVLPFTLSISSSASAPFNFLTWVNPPWITNLSLSAATGDPDAIKCVSDIISTGFGILAPEIGVGLALSNYALSNAGSLDQFQSGVDFTIGFGEKFGAAGTAFDFLQGADSAWGAYSLLRDCVQTAQHSSTASLTPSPVTSLDPNDKVGPSGIGAFHFTSGQQALPYSIYFDNQPDASAPAQTVTITDTLNANLDPTTLTLGPITFPNQVIRPPSIPLSVIPFTTTADLRPTTNLLVKITVAVNTSTGVLTWNFQSLDPATNQPPTDPLAGFLPPGAEGSVFFTAMPKSDVGTGTVIQNTATVVFDVNSPINTPIWSNTIDNTAPTSKVSALPPTEETHVFPVQWSGTDVGAGIQDFTIYVSDNGGPFTLWLTNTTGTQGMYSGTGGHTYAFYSIARDLVGNFESAKTVAEATTQVIVDTTPPVIVPQITGTLGNNGWYTSNVTVIWNVSDPESGIASSTGCATATLTTDTAGVSLGCTATNGAGLSSSSGVTIKIDKTPPVVSGMPAAGCSLWPPNGKLIEVATVTAADTLSGLAPASFQVTGTSNEPSNSQKNPEIVIASNGTGGYVVQLQADRLGTGNGRAYTLNAKAMDNAGNSATVTSSCTVPHDQGH